MRKFLLVIFSCFFLAHSFTARADSIPSGSATLALASAQHGGPFEFYMTGFLFSLRGFVPAPEIGLPSQFGPYAMSFFFQGGNNGPMGHTEGALSIDGAAVYATFAGSALIVRRI